MYIYIYIWDKKKKPTNNLLPFLNTLVSLNHETKKFSTTLYVKSIHSKSITLWDSHGLISSKRVILTRETRRAISRSTDPSSRTKSLFLITSIFTYNGYPIEFVKSVIKCTLSHKEDQRSIRYYYRFTATR